MIVGATLLAAGIGISAVGAVTGLVTSLGWAGLDASRKALGAHVDAVPLVVLLSLGQLPLFGIWAATTSPWPSLDPAYVRPAAISLALNVVANVLFMVAVRRSPLSLVIPLLAFVPVLSTLVAQPLLGELPGPIQLAGIATVVVGALSLGADGAEGRGPVAMARAILREPGTLPMLGVAAAWSLTLIFDKQAVRSASVASHAMVLNAGLVVCLGGWLLARGRLSRLAAVRKTPRAFVAAVLFSVVALGFQLLAVQHLLVGVLEAVKRAIGITMSVIVGRVMFDEAVTRAKVLAVVLLVAGTVAIVLGPPA